jgi:hypothetical protein
VRSEFCPHLPTAHGALRLGPTYSTRRTPGLGRDREPASPRCPGDLRPHAERPGRCRRGSRAVRFSRLGWINPDLYAQGALSEHGVPTAIVDITTGNNTFAGVAGLNATPGYDLASGWGTVNADEFVHALARF